MNIGMSITSIALGLSRLWSRVVGPTTRRAEVDVALVVSEWNRGLAPDRIASEIDRHCGQSSRVCHVAPLFPSRSAGRVPSARLRQLSLTTRLRSRRLPLARSYLFIHSGIFHQMLVWNPHLWHARTIVAYAHPLDPDAPLRAQLRLLHGADFIITMNEGARQLLVAAGWPAGRIATVLCGADAGRFRTHVRGTGAVGLCSGFQPRKAPERVLDVARAMPERRFILLGRRWEQWSRYAELQSLANFRYVEGLYEDYPEWYAKMDVFLSPSAVEGGPLPLLEAMASNCVPVTSRTGFAPDVITHGQNGFLFDAGATTAEVCALVESAFRVTTDIRSTVAHLTWERYARDTLAYVRPDASTPSC